MVEISPYLLNTRVKSAFRLSPKSPTYNFVEAFEERIALVFFSRSSAATSKTTKTTTKTTVATARHARVDSGARRITRRPNDGGRYLYPIESNHNGDMRIPSFVSGFYFSFHSFSDSHLAAREDFLASDLLVHIMAPPKKVAGVSTVDNSLSQAQRSCCVEKASGDDQSASATGYEIWQIRSWLPSNIEGSAQWTSKTDPCLSEHTSN